MNRIVEQLLRVARLDAVALDVSGTVDLNDVASEVVATLAPWALAQDRSIAFAGPDRPVPIQGNKHAIGDAIRNLVENAVMHSPPRSEVTVSVAEAGHVSVLDRGPGVPPEQQELIFERFWRGKATASNGAGLGLAIVREIMNAHRGSIRVEQRPAGGASFTLCFALSGAAGPNGVDVTADSFGIVRTLASRSSTTSHVSEHQRASSSTSSQSALGGQT
jgi:signal transduction histidine kinase